MSPFAGIMHIFSVQARQTDRHTWQGNNMSHSLWWQGATKNTKLLNFGTDEYAYCIPNPNACLSTQMHPKVPRTQDKHAQLSSFAELCCYPC